MIKVLFVCLGNICRSPMAECIFTDYINKNNLQTSFEEVGNGIDYRAKEMLKTKNIAIVKHTARRITKEDYENFDYIIGMDSSNVQNILRIVGEDKDRKIYRLLDFTNNSRDILDPWYTGNFEKAYNDILTGIEFFFKNIKKN